MNKILDHINKQPQLKLQFEPQNGNNYKTGENVYISESVSMLLSALQKKLEMQMQNELRNQVHPKIKGGITQGKLTNRGIKLVFNIQDMTTWYEQRGFQCTRKYKLIIEPQ